jgi:hypothetical protein
VRRQVAQAVSLHHRYDERVVGQQAILLAYPLTAMQVLVTHRQDFDPQAVNLTGHGQVLAQPLDCFGMSLQVVDRFGRCGESKAGAGLIDHNTVDGLTGSNCRGVALNLAAAAPLKEIPARRS